MEKAFLSPKETIATIIVGGRRVLSQSLGRTFVLSLLAGIYISFGAQLATVVTSDAAAHLGSGIAQLLGGSVFSVGLMLVVCGAKLRATIAIEVRTARDAMIEAGAIVAAASRTLEQAQRLLAMAEKGFEFGVKTRIDVDDAQVNLLQAQTFLARGERDYLAARAQFAWATGSESVD